MPSALALSRPSIETLPRPSSQLAIAMLAGFSPSGSTQYTHPHARDSDADQPDRAEEQDARTAASDLATALPTSTQVIQEGERQIETGSRALRRIHSRAELTQQFQSSREAFRSALQSASQSAESDVRTPASPAAPQVEGAKPADVPPPPTAAQAGAPEPPPKAAPTPQPAASSPPPSAAGNSNGSALSAASVQVAASSAAPPAPVAVPVATANAVTQAINGTGGIALVARAATASGPSQPAPAAAAADRNAPRNTVAAVRAAAKAAAPDKADREAQIERLVRMIRTRIEKGRTHAVMRLDPPKLGRIRLEIDVRQREITLRLETETSAAYRLLREEIDVLRHGLASEGIRLVEIDVRHVDAPDAPLQEQASDGRGHGNRDAGRGSAGGQERCDLGDAQDASSEWAESSAAESRVNLVA